MFYRTAGVFLRFTALLYMFCAKAAFAHDVFFDSKWGELQFMDDEALVAPPAPRLASTVHMEVDVLEIRAGRGKRVANSITGRVVKGREQSGVLADEQYEELLRSVSEGWNLRAFQSTVVTFADRLGTTGWAPEEQGRQALIDLRFARNDGGLWEGSVEFQGVDADQILQAEFQTTANRFFLRGKSRGDWLLVVTVQNQDVVNEPVLIPERSTDQLD